jgi:hypothetical protein
MGLTWALPILLAHSPLVRWLEEQASNRVGTTVRIGALSLGWFSPVIASDVEVLEPDGRPLLCADRVESDRTLLGLLFNSNAPGAFRVTGASAEVILSEGASNVEVNLGHLFPASPSDVPGDSGPAALPPLEIEVVDAVVKVTDAATGHSWACAPLEANVRLFQDDETPVEARIHGAVGDGSDVGTAEAFLTVYAEGGVWKHGEVKGRLQGVPLGLVNPLLRRIAPGAEVAGQLSGQAFVSWGMDRGAVTWLAVEGEVGARGCELAGPGLAERLVLDQVRMPCKVRYDATGLEISRAELSCDLGQARLSGRFDPTLSGLGWLDRPGIEVVLSLDLLRIAEKLPRTLRLHPDLNLTAGELRLEARSADAAGAALWEGRLHVTNIHAVRGTQPVTWQEPVVLDFRARQSRGGVPVFEEVRCASAFLQIEGGATGDGYRLHAEGDVGKLADPLSRFVDLGPVRLVGQAQADVSIRRLAGTKYIADACARVTDLLIDGLPGRPLQEDLVTFELVADGRTDEGAAGVDSARLRLALGPDRVQAELVEPAAEGWGQWNLRLEGDLGRWQGRLGAYTGLPDGWEVAGSVQAEARIRFVADTADYTDVWVSARNFRLSGPGFLLTEPDVQLKARARSDQGSGALELAAVQLRSGVLSADAPRFRWQVGTTAVEGIVTIHGELARLAPWLNDPNANSPHPLAGHLTGRFELQHAEDHLGIGFLLSVQDFGWSAGTAAWHEPQVKLSGHGRFDPDHDRVAFDQLHLESELLNADAQGAIDHVGDTRDLDLAGELRYDLAKLQPHLAALMGDVRISGHDTRPFRLTGPLCPPAQGRGLRLDLDVAAPTPDMQARGLRGDAVLAWDSLHAMGWDVGPANLRLILQKGWLQLYPLETTVNGGKLQLQPNLRLEPGPVELVIPAGPVVTRARISAEMCAGALGYTLPVLANAAEVDGQFSLTLDGARVPLADPARAEVKGTVILHDVRVGPGPLMKELSVLLVDSATARLAPQRPVPFQIVNGRVYHQDLELAFPDLNVRISGSVGLDKSLALLAEMPVPPRLLGTNRLPPALANETIRLPISGTIEQPRLDQKALQSVLSHLARELAADALKHGLENKLKGLLKPGGGN